MLIEAVAQALLQVVGVQPQGLEEVVARGPGAIVGELAAGFVEVAAGGATLLPVIYPTEIANAGYPI